MLKHLKSLYLVPALLTYFTYAMEETEQPGAGSTTSKEKYETEINALDFYQRLSSNYLFRTSPFTLDESPDVYAQNRLAIVAVESDSEEQNQS